jgi:chromatin segregation and condensation protein Rec8/ScpA/Scc1 (kleisin family)
MMHPRAAGIALGESEQWKTEMDMKVPEKYRTYENALRRAHYFKPAPEFIVRWEAAGCPKQFEGLNMRHRLADLVARIAARDTTVIQNPQEFEKRKAKVSAK